MAAFSLCTREVNRHFLVNKDGDLSFFSLVLNGAITLISLCYYKLNASQFQEQEAIAGNVNLASNREYNQNDIIRNYWV